MKIFVLIFLAMAFQTQAQTDVTGNIRRDLELVRSLRDIGGAGNGGNEMALHISKQINMYAAQVGVRNLKKFIKRYSLIVGKYSFCGETNACHTSAVYFPDYNTILVDKSSWIKMSETEWSETIKVLVEAIDNDR